VRTISYYLFYLHLYWFINRFVHSSAVKNKGKARKMDSPVRSDSDGRTGAMYVLTAALILSRA
jgi:hypothetical protein